MDINKTTHLPKPQGARNGLIDLYRFLLSLVVVKSHSLFIVGGSYFGPGRVCVEFFFVLSGYLFASFLQKTRELSLKDSLLRLVRSKLMPLLIPLSIGVLSNIIQWMLTGDGSLFGYLWYVEVMLVEMAVLVLLQKLIKRERAFTYTVVGIMIVALVLKFSGLCYSWGYIRGASAIPMGILIAKLPKLKPRSNALLLIPLIAVFAICFCIVCYGLGDVEWFGFRLLELLLDNLFYPVLIYLSFCIEFRSKLCSYLGALSFGLYAFQCPADLLRTLGVKSPALLFGFILLATLLEDGGKRIYRYTKSKPKGNTQKSH